MKLLFVYNADSGLAALLFDSAHKLLSPQTYECNLCALTHGLAGPKKQWANFLKTLPEPPKFLHRDEFLKTHPGLVQTTLPAIFRMQEEDIHLLVDARCLATLDSLEKLIAILSKA